MNAALKLYKWCHDPHRGFSTNFSHFSENSVTMRMSLTVKGLTFIIEKSILAEEALQATVKWRTFVANVLCELRRNKQWNLAYVNKCKQRELDDNKQS